MRPLDRAGAHYGRLWCAVAHHGVVNRTYPATSALAGRRRVVVVRVQPGVRVVVDDGDGLDQQRADLARQGLGDRGDDAIVIVARRLAHGEDELAGVGRDAGTKDTVVTVVLVGLESLEELAGLQRDGHAGLHVLAGPTDDMSLSGHPTRERRLEDREDRVLAAFGHVVVAVVTARLQARHQGNAVAAEDRLDGARVVDQRLAQRVGQRVQVSHGEAVGRQMRDDLRAVLVTELDVGDLLLVASDGLVDLGVLGHLGVLSPSLHSRFAP